jgi:hypothetical protein
MGVPGMSNTETSQNNIFFSGREGWPRINFRLHGVQFIIGHAIPRVLPIRKNKFTDIAFHITVGKANG